LVPVEAVGELSDDDGFESLLAALESFELSCLDDESPSDEPEPDADVSDSDGAEEADDDRFDLPRLSVL